MIYVQFAWVGEKINVERDFERSNKLKNELNTIALGRNQCIVYIAVG